MRIARPKTLGAAAATAALLLCPLPAAADADPWDLQSRLELELDGPDPEAGPAATRSLEEEPFAADESVLDDFDARRARIEAHRPRAAEGSRLPTALVMQVSLRWGVALAWLGDHESAAFALARAVALGHDHPDSWRRLGQARARSGDLDGAEAALLAALERASDRNDKALVFRDLGEVYLAMGQPVASIASLERGLDLTPNALRVLELYARARHEAAPQSDPEPSRPVRLFGPTPGDRTRAAWEAALGHAADAMPLSVKHQLRSLGRHAVDAEGRHVLLGAIGVLLLIWLFWRRRKGRGDLEVTLAYPPELTGSFSVRLASTPGRYKRSRSGKVAATDGSAPTSTRIEHFAVSRETKFQGLSEGLWYVTVEGLLQDPSNGEVVTDPHDEQAVQILSNQTVQIGFDVAPRESVVEVRVSWDGSPARDAAVAARGRPESLRYARDGATRLSLSKGLHTIVIGSGDRIAECEVEVESFRTASIEVDLGSSEDLVFKGCPPAVEPYLNGDLNAAAHALERDGHTQLANLLYARLHQEHGRSEAAAGNYENAGRSIEAAELRAELGQWEEAARLFLEGAAPGRAGDMLRAADELVRAGRCYQQAGDLDSAISCYEEAGEHGAWIDTLEKSGAIFPAAKIAVEHREQGRAIRLLQMIQLDHADYVEACELLTEAYLQQGHRDLATQKIEERILARPADQTPADIHYQLANLLGQEGEFDKALEVLSELRVREPTYPNIATRIEGLRKKQSERDLAASRGATGSVSTPTTFLEDSRYQILAEVGRGGMGVVLKARDTRLERTVALKRLPETLRDHPKAIQLFLREAQAAARLNHPNITTVYDTDQQDGVFFITMELLEGLPISKILRERGRLSEKNAAQLGVQITAGLDYAHEKGIVHRDIKGANLFFTVDKVVKIMDFGLAKMMEEVRRGTTVIGGTPYYMAPEQAAGETVDHRADIYALGVTLYEFVTRELPFQEGDVTYQHRHAPAPDPRETVPELSEAFASLVLEMMAKDPADRVQSAAEVGRRLSALIP